MYNYTPFLKLKVSEISALKELGANKKNNFIPFFDFPRKKPKKSRYSGEKKAIKISYLRMIWIDLKQNLIAP